MAISVLNRSHRTSSHRQVASQAASAVRLCATTEYSTISTTLKNISHSTARCFACLRLCLWGRFVPCDPCARNETQLQPVREPRLAINGQGTICPLTPQREKQAGPSSMLIPRQTCAAPAAGVDSRPRGSRAMCSSTLFNDECSFIARAPLFVPHLLVRLCCPYRTACTGAVTRPLLHLGPHVQREPELLTVLHRLRLRAASHRHNTRDGSGQHCSAAWRGRSQMPPVTLANLHTQAPCAGVLCSLPSLAVPGLCHRLRVELTHPGH